VIHELPLERRTLHGHFSRDLPPALTVDPGDSVAFATPNSGWMLDRETEFGPRQRRRRHSGIVGSDAHPGAA
jgi:acetamidase/formamidase